MKVKNTFCKTSLNHYVRSIQRNVNRAHCFWNYIFFEKSTSLKWQQWTLFLSSGWKNFEEIEKNWVYKDYFVATQVGWRLSLRELGRIFYLAFGFFKKVQSWIPLSKVFFYPKLLSHKNKCKRCRAWPSQVV